MHPWLQQDHPKVKPRPLLMLQKALKALELIHLSGLIDSWNLTLLYTFVTLRTYLTPFCPCATAHVNFPLIHQENSYLSLKPKMPSVGPCNLIWPSNQLVHAISSPTTISNPITSSSVCCHTSITVLTTLLCNDLPTHVPTLLIIYVYIWQLGLCLIEQSINIW